MMKRLCQYLYARNKALFQSLLVEDLIGEIPQSVQEPANDFLTTAGLKLEKWLLYQSWVIQRKALNEPKYMALYHGMLVEIKLLLMIASKKKAPAMPLTPVRKKEADPLEGVSDFVKGFKKTEVQ